MFHFFPSTLYTAVPNKGEQNQLSKEYMLYLRQFELDQMNTFSKIYICGAVMILKSGHSNEN